MVMKVYMSLFKKDSLKILYLQDTAMWYRRPFFFKLNEIYDIKFIFTYMEYITHMYSIEQSWEIDELDKLKYKIIKSYCNNKYIDVAFCLLRDLLMEDYDIIVDMYGSIDMLYCFLAAKLRRKPIVLCSDVWGWKRKKSLHETLILPFNKFFVYHTDAILVPGIKQKEYYISLGALPDKIFIMPNVSGLVVRDEDYEHKKNLKEKLSIENKKVILYVGRLVKQKGVEYLIKAFAKLREEMDDIVLIIIGHGECKDELLLLSKNLDIENHIYFMGFIENVHLSSYYLLCNVCVIPSITHGQADCWGYVVNEAMHCGKPVIATDAVGAAFEMIRNNENGFIVPEKDVNALYVALKKIISNSDLEKKMGIESKKIIESGFEYKHMIEVFKNAISSLGTGSK